MPDATSSKNVASLKSSHIKQLLSNHKDSDQGEDYANERFEEDWLKYVEKGKIKNTQIHNLFKVIFN